MKKRVLRLGIMEVLLLVSLYVLPRYWRGFVPELMEQGRFDYQVYISPLLIALAIVGVLYGMGVVQPQHKPLSLLPAVVLGWVAVFVTDTPVWGICGTVRGNCVVPGALMLLMIFTIECVAGLLVRRKRGFDVRQMALSLGMMLCACAPTLQYFIGQALIAAVASGGSPALFPISTAQTYLLLLAGGLPLLPYFNRMGDRALGVLLLATGLSGPLVQFLSVATMHSSHFFYAAVSEYEALTAFAAVAAAGIAAMRARGNGEVKSILRRLVIRRTK